MPVTNTVSARFELQPGQSWFYWFYPNGGAYSDYEVTDRLLNLMAFAVRPWAHDHWDIQHERTIVVKESEPGSARSRHSYRVLVRNTSTTTPRSFFIIASDIRP